MYWDSPPARALRAGGVPVYRDIEAVVDTLGARSSSSSEARSLGVPELGEPAPPVAGDGYFESRELLAAAGVPFAPRAARPRSTRRVPPPPSSATRSC